MSTSPPASQEAAFVELDVGALSRLRDLDPDGHLRVVPRVLATFEKSLQRMLLQVADKGAADDAGAVADLAHTLKSSSAAVGALQLARACSEVERRVRAAVPGDLQADVRRLLSEGQAALLAVRSQLTA